MTTLPSKKATTAVTTKFTTKATTPTTRKPTAATTKSTTKATTPTTRKPTIATTKTTTGVDEECRNFGMGLSNRHLGFK